MNVRYKAPASHEFEDAYKWYVAQAPLLGERFLIAVERAVERLRVYPRASAPDSDGIRCALVADFPFGLHYLIDGDDIVIYAVSHTHRKPKYWIDRLGQSTLD